MIWLHGTTGRGPQECQQALFGLHGVIQKEAKENELSLETVDFEETDNGLASFLLAVEGENELTFAESWQGTIQWICPSTIRPTHKRKRWFVGISLLRLDNPTSLVIVDSDLKWDTMRASGPGGQNVQKTDSAVRLTHLPSGIVIMAQEERSQHRNKSLARARLIAALEAAQKDFEDANKKSLWSEHNSLERGNAIRTYEGSNFRRKI